MIISWNGGPNFVIKSKNMTIKIGDKISLGDLEISEPGEYEVGGVQTEVIDGIIEIYTEGLIIGHIKKAKTLSDEELEKLSSINVLLIGVGGNEFSENKTASEVINQIDPSIVIPMHSGDLGEFAKEEGASVEGKEEIKITKADLPEEGRRVVVLNARS